MNTAAKTAIARDFRSSFLVRLVQCPWQLSEQLLQQYFDDAWHSERFVRALTAAAISLASTLPFVEAYDLFQIARVERQSAKLHRRGVSATRHWAPNDISRVVAQLELQKSTRNSPDFAPHPVRDNTTIEERVWDTSYPADLEVSQPCLYLTHQAQGRTVRSSTPEESSTRPNHNNDAPSTRHLAGPIQKTRRRKVVSQSGTTLVETGGYSSESACGSCKFADAVTPRPEDSGRNYSLRNKNNNSSTNKQHISEARVNTLRLNVPHSCSTTLPEHHVRAISVQGIVPTSKVSSAPNESQHDCSATNLPSFAVDPSLAGDGCGIKQDICSPVASIRQELLETLSTALGVAQLKLSHLAKTSISFQDEHRRATGEHPHAQQYESRTQPRPQERLKRKRSILVLDDPNHGQEFSKPAAQDIFIATVSILKYVHLMLSDDTIE